MTNVCFILPKQLCRASAAKHGLAGVGRIAARQTFTSRWFASIAPVKAANLHASRTRQDSMHPKTSERSSVFQSFRFLHSSPTRLKRSLPGNNYSLKQKPQRRPPRVAERAKIPFGAISKAELANIYQYDVDYVQGNEVLRMLHERRLNGSLIDKGLEPETETTIPTKSLPNALQWLRKEYPTDEKEAAQQWTAQETARLQAKYIADAERFGIYKPVENPRAQSSTDTSISALDEIKRYNEQKRIQKEQELEKSGQAQASRELALARQEQKEKTQLERTERISKRREERAVKGMVSHEPLEIPALATVQRIIYPSLFGFACLFLIGLGSYFYVPVQQADRIFPNVPISVATVGGIAALNVFVWVLWRFPPAWKTLNTYFTQVPAYPYAFSVLGNTVSHRKFMHLASNVFVGLFFFGIDVHEELGRMAFVDMYLSGCIMGSLFSLYYYVATRQFSFYSQGASGGVIALMTAWAVFTANKPASSPETHAFALDVSRWAIIGMTFFGHFVPKVRAGIDWMSHIGGAVAGLLFSLGTIAARKIEKAHVIKNQPIHAKERHITSEDNSGKA